MTSDEQAIRGSWRSGTARRLPVMLTPCLASWRDAHPSIESTATGKPWLPLWSLK